MPSRLHLPSLYCAALLLVSPALFAAEIVKSPNDHRDYQFFTLPNALKVLLVSDPEADKAAAALNVAVGSGAEPADRQGLAHFLEHMLFLGTEQYPEPDEYQAFIAAHGGNHNAFTGFEDTNYFFDVDADHLLPALDRFAQFFVAPLFNPEYVEREKNAVHSEYQMLRQRDGWRARDAVHQLANPDHPMGRFVVGSLETLADREGRPVRDDLLDFYRNHYSANLMSLVVIGREPLDTLREWVEERFAAIPNHNAEQPVFEGPLYDLARLPARVDIEPIQEARQLNLSFPIPAAHEFYRQNPVGYIGNLLGHEGKGSLLSLLKARGWADGLSAGQGISHRDNATFSVSVNLTEAGLAHVDEIADLTFDYLHLIREAGIQEWLFEEQSRLGEINFRFKEPDNSVGFASYLARALQIYPPQDVLRAPYMMDEYDPRLLRRFLSLLTPERALLSVRAPDLTVDSRSPWFDAPYKITPVADDTLAEWQSQDAVAALQLPEPNPFIPESLELKTVADPSPIPELVLEKPGLALWYQQDSEFRTPRTDFFFSVRSPVAVSSPHNTVLTELYVDLVRDELNEFAYPAQLAGLDYSIYRHVRGFSVRISGYDDKQAVLLERILDTLTAPDLDAQRFEVLKDRQLRELRNVVRGDPHRLARDEVSDLLLTPYWDEAERVEALETLSVADLQAFIPQLLGEVDLVALAHGNLSAEEARLLASKLDNSLLANAEAVDVARTRVVKLTGEEPHLRRIPVEQNDSAIAYYFQGEDRSVSTRAYFGLLGQVLHPAFFADLRTDKQLGYVVYASPMPLMEVPGLAFVVQSPVADPEALSAEVERFIDEHREILATMDDEEFQRQKAALRSQLLEKDQRLNERSERYWREIDRENYNFDTHEQLAEVLMDIDRESFLAFYDRVLRTDSPRQLIVQVQGSSHPGEMARVDDSQTIHNLQLFKQGRDTFSG